MDWKKLEIYVMNKPLLLEKALETLSDDMIYDGGYCDETIMNLRDACLNLISIIEAENPQEQIEISELSELQEENDQREHKAVSHYRSGGWYPRDRIKSSKEGSNISELSKFQEEVGKWGDEIFNPTNLDKIQFCVGRIEHFFREAIELRNSPLRDLPEEVADCFHLLLHIAHIMDFDLLKAARKKLEINRKRKWGPPDKDGVIEHIEEK